MTPFPRALAWFTVLLFSVLVVVLSWAAYTSPAPPLGSLVLFTALMIFSVNRGVRLAHNVFISPYSLVVVASVVVFGSTGVYSGVIAVAALGALYRPALRRRSWGWVPFNAAMMGLAAGGAAAVYAVVVEHGTETLPQGFVTLAAVALAYTLISYVVLLGSYAIEMRSIPSEVLVTLPRSVVEIFPFAALGYVFGLMYLSLGPVITLLVIVPILIAREMFASYIRVKELHEETVHMLVRALESKDHYTAGHAERVANFAMYMGEELNFLPARMERLRFAALMHDIGKLVVPNHILNKPGRLTPEEFDLVRMHEKVGVQMLAHIDFLQPIASTAHADATRFDPDDLDHPIEPYIVMIADAYDAMTSTRSYRKALPQAVAVQELRDKAGVQFHPQCVEAFIRAIEARGEKHGRGYEIDAAFEAAPDAGLGSAGLGDLLPRETA